MKQLRCGVATRVPGGTVAAIAVRKSLAAATAAVLLAACGGGGGGGTSNPVRPNTDQPTIAGALPPLAVSADEIGRSSYIAQSGARTAWDQGYGGRGVTVAILDSGLAAGLDEFSGRVHAASGNYVEDANGSVVKNAPVTDDVGHGTWVASVLGAGANELRTVGVAPEATLLALGFFAQADMTGPNSMLVNPQRLSQALAASRAAGARVVNGSFSLDGDSPTFRSALQQSVAAGQLLVFAAGNEGNANPSATARYAREAWANGQIVAVGAVDAQNTLAGYSNRAGDTLQFYLVARGDVTVTGTDGALLNVVGTSFAAPQVSGAAALLGQKWPQLTAPQIAGVLFTSATDLGDPGTDAVYGRGLLNIDRAMQPLGQPTIAIADGAAAPLDATALVLPAGGVASAVVAAAGTLTVAATDDFGRDFATDLAPRMLQVGSLAFAELQQGLARDIHGLDGQAGGLRFSVLPAVHALGERRPPGSGSFFGYGERARWQFAGGTADRLDQFFGLEGGFRGLAHPYFKLAADGQFAGTGVALSDHARLRAGALSAGAASGQVLDLAYSSRGRFEPRLRAGDWNLALTAGAVTEKDRLLGMSGSGALALAPGRSAFATFGAQYWLDARTEIAGSFTLGRTAASGVGLLQFSPLTAWSAEARIARAGQWLAGDRLALSLGRPLVIADGTLSLIVPTRINDDGELGFRRSRLNLGGGVAETRLGLSYAVPDGRRGKMSVVGLLRLNADNEPGRRESLLGLRYRRAFD